MSNDKRAVSRIVMVAGIVLAVLLLGAGGLIARMQHALHNVPCQEALYHASKHPDVIDALGEPIDTGYWVTGTLTTSSSGADGSASLVVPISGPNRAGEMLVRAAVQSRHLSHMAWVFEPVVVEIDGGPRITMTIPPRGSRGRLATGSYVDALRMVRSDERVIARLGERIEDDPSDMRGGFSEGGGQGQVDFDIRIAGPKGRAYLVVRERSCWWERSEVVELGGHGGFRPLGLTGGAVACLLAHA